MDKYINVWQRSRESVLHQNNHFLVTSEVREAGCTDFPSIHNHIFTEIEFISKGSCTQVINGHETKCGSGMLLFMFPQDVHHYTAFHESTKLYSLCFADDMLPGSVLDLLYTKNGALLAHLSEKDTEKIETCFKKLLKENEEQNLCGDLLIRAYILEIAVEILRKAKTTRFGISNPAIRKALQYIRENFKQTVTLKDLAKSVHLTPEYFCKLFKTELCISFHEYLRNIRLDYALMLLSTTSMTVTEVCLESGFSSASNFTKIFKQRFGISPKTARK